MPHKKPGKVLFKAVESAMWLFRVLALILVVGFLFSDIRTIETTNVGIRTHFGKIIPDGNNKNVRDPGIVLLLPYPVDELIQVPKAQTMQVEITDVWHSLTDTATMTKKINPLLEGYCITGDTNVVQTKIVAKYKIADAQAYQFGLANPQELIHDLVLASLTQTISGWNVDEVLKMQRSYALESPASGAVTDAETVMVVEKLAELVARRAQQRLDALDSGIRLTDVEIVQMHYPRHVNKDFENVQVARTAAAMALDTAKGEAQRAKLAAERFAGNMTTRADREKKEVLSRAEAEQSEFLPLYREYHSAPEHVVKRIYMDTIQRVLENVGTTKIVPAGTRVIIPNTEERE